MILALRSTLALTATAALLASCHPMIDPPGGGGDTEEPQPTTGGLAVTHDAQHFLGAVPQDENTVLTVRVRNRDGEPRTIDAIDLEGQPTRWQRYAVTDAQGTLITFPYTLGPSGSATEAFDYRIICDSRPTVLTVAFRDPDIVIHSRGEATRYPVPSVRYAPTQPTLYVYDAIVNDADGTFSLLVRNTSGQDVVITDAGVDPKNLPPRTWLSMDDGGYPRTVPAGDMIELTGRAGDVSDAIGFVWGAIPVVVSTATSSVPVSSPGHVYLLQP